MSKFLLETCQEFFPLKSSNGTPGTPKPTKRQDSFLAKESNGTPKPTRRQESFSSKDSNGTPNPVICIDYIRVNDNDNMDPLLGVKTGSYEVITSKGLTGVLDTTL